jgi:LysM repeat protein
MKKLLLPLLFIFSISSVYSFQSTDEIKKVGGKDYRVYKIQKGDTWYAIARKFEISYAELRVANKETDDKIITGQELLIPAKLKPNDPYFQKNLPETPPKESPKTQSGSDKFHTVMASQTLYSISKMYNVSVDKIKAWNNLPSNEISVGQKLLVGKKSVDAEPVKQIAVPVTEPVAPSSEQKAEEPPVVVKTEKIDSAKIEVESKSKDVSGQTGTPDTSIITSQVEDMPSPAQDTKLPDEAPPVSGENSPKGTDEVVFSNGRQQVNETGSAVVIDDDENNSEKYYALHKTAKIGTVIRVMNLANSKKTYVKVVGQLSDDSANNSTLIKISKSTAEKLGITEKTGRVNLLYGIGGD